MTENTKKANNNIKLRKELRKVYSVKDSAFKTFEYKLENTYDLRNVSQASACDLLIDKMLISKVKSNNILRALVDFVNSNDVYMRNYDNNKSLIIARLKRHLTSDCMTRLEKRSIQLT